jgi:hypothetical protein
VNFKKDVLLIGYVVIWRGDPVICAK